MTLRLRSGSTDAVEGLEELLAGIDDAQIDAEVLLEDLAHQVGLAVAQQPGVDEDAGEPLAERALQQCRDDRGVDAAAEPADDALVVGDPRGDARGGLLEQSATSPVAPDAADLERSGRASAAGFGVCATSGWNWRP